MSAIYVKGKIVSKDSRKVKNKAGEEFEITTYYVVNSGGPPIAMQPARGQVFKVDQDIALPVYVKVFRDQLTYVQIGQ